jgi:hypothetical protein
VNLSVEAGEKVPKQILGRDAERSSLIECATINDLMLKKDQENPPKTSFPPGKGPSYSFVT